MKERDVMLYDTSSRVPPTLRMSEQLAKERVFASHDGELHSLRP